MAHGRRPDRIAPILGRVRHVLVQPQFGGNTGSCARVLKNLGFGRLVLVDPAFGLEDREASKMAVAAGDVLGAATVVSGIDDALAGAGMVIGTSRRLGKHRQPHDRIDDLGPSIAAFAAAGGEVAVVFGREDHGLSDRDLDRCTHLAYLPASEAYPSFNLGQAVGIVSWEVACAAEAHVDAGRQDDPEDDSGEGARASDHVEREAMFRHLETALRTVGYLHPESAEPVMRRLRRLIARATPTETEVRVLRGIARQVLWAADQAGLPRQGGAEDDGRPG